MDENEVRLQMTRREFVRRSALAAAALTLSGCVPVTPAVAPTSAPVAPTAVPPPAATTAPVASAATARKGGTLTWGQWDKNDDLDPATASGAAALEIIGNVLDTLVTIDATQRVHPLLATSWKIEDNSKKYTFTIRDDVKCHDGSMMNADAVKRTWERILDPKTKAAGVIPLFGPIDKIDAPDAKTLVVTFKDPNTLFLQNIWRPYLGILSPKLLDSLKPGDKVMNLVGSGPFKYVGRSADGVVTIEAYADYAWGPALFKNTKAPYLQSVKFRAVPEAATRVATLESGENLLIDELAEPDYARMKSDKRFSFLETPRRGIAIGFFINVQKEPTNELAVRQALNYAVDRKSIVEKLYFGVHKANVGILTEGVWARLDDLENLYAYDPKKAAQILDDAGWKVGGGGIREKGGKKLGLILTTFRSPWSEIAEVVQSQYRDVGIDLQVQKMERNPYLDFVRAYNHHLCASAGSGIDPDQLRERFHSSGITVGNFSNYADKELDPLLEKGSQQAFLSDERRQTYEAIQRRLMNQLPFVSVLQQMRVEAMSAKVHDMTMGPEGLNANSLNDVWLDA